MAGKTVPGYNAAQMTDDEENEDYVPWWEAQIEINGENSAWNQMFTASVDELLQDYSGRENATGRHAHVVAIMSVSTAITKVLETSLGVNDPYPGDFNEGFNAKLRTSLAHHLPQPQTPTRELRRMDLSDADEDVTVSGLPTPVSLPANSPSRSRKPSKQPLPASPRSSKFQNATVASVQEAENLATAASIDLIQQSARSDTVDTRVAEDGMLDNAPTVQETFNGSTFTPFNVGMTLPASKDSHGQLDMDTARGISTENHLDLETRVPKASTSNAGMTMGSVNHAVRATRKRKSPGYSHDADTDTEADDDGDIVPSPSKKTRSKVKEAKAGNDDNKKKAIHIEEEQPTVIVSENDEDHVEESGFETNVDDIMTDVNPEASFEDRDALQPTKSPYFPSSKKSEPQGQANHAHTPTTSSSTLAQIMTDKLQSTVLIIANPEADKHIRHELTKLWKDETSPLSQATYKAYDFVLHVLSASALHSIVNQWDHATRQADVGNQSATNNNIDRASLSEAMQLTMKALNSISQAVGTGFQSTILKWRGMLNLEIAQQKYLSIITAMPTDTQQELENINNMINRDLATMVPSNKTRLSVRTPNGIEETVKELFDAVFIAAKFRSIISTKNRRRQGKVIGALVDVLGEGALALTCLPGFPSFINTLNLTKLSDILRVVNKQKWVNEVMIHLKGLIDVPMQGQQEVEEQSACANLLKEKIYENHSLGPGIQDDSSMGSDFEDADSMDIEY